MIASHAPLRELVKPARFDSSASEAEVISSSEPLYRSKRKLAALAVETTRVSEQEAGKGQDLPGLPHRLRCVLLTTEDFSMSAPTDVRTYPAGVPCWIDSEQRDLQAACAFYGELFGWVFSDAASPERAGTYYVAAVDGRDVA